jgi:hypothetical protein
MADQGDRERAGNKGGDVERESPQISHNLFSDCSIPLTRGLVALVDPPDHAALSEHKWYAHKAAKGFYAARWTKTGTVYMHRQIMAPARGLVVDHINHDTLDNRRDNLRVCTQKQNLANRRAAARSLPLGVWERDGRYLSCLVVDGRTRHLGTFDTPEAAHTAYATAAREHRGEYARTA